MMTRSSFPPPYVHFAMIYLDCDGKLTVDESSSIQEQNSTLFTLEVRRYFLEILGKHIGASVCQRIELLLHIIPKLDTYGITADKLKDITSGTKRSLKHVSHIETIYKILRVRRMEERFERGEVGANMVVYTMIRSHNLKGNEGDDSTTLVAQHISHGIMNPTSPFEQASTSLTTPIDNIPSNRYLPSRFSMAEPLNFENPACQGRHYYATPTQCSDNCRSPCSALLWQKRKSAPMKSRSQLSTTPLTTPIQAPL
ncbi:hypothetical protein VN97_g3099 [Penicillium thymicola]|uniref:Uncharacterized protein n=1 Tax=Penicillium thymicola TaxID=293382 RepID=A0AAI9XBL9_PENTH|nr:hypothetical protein VN97_g3099 [Penicillium thymicola]